MLTTHSSASQPGRQKDIKSIIGLIRDLMLSSQAREPQPWLQLKLTREQLRIMFLLSHNGRSSPGEVARAFGVPGANLTRTIERLVEKGLVNRMENPDDRRSYILSLTEKGNRQIEHLRAMGAARIARMLERMPDDALVSLRVGLEALIRTLKDGEEMNGHNRSR